MTSIVSYFEYNHKMRADRLISLLLLLETRGLMTAASLASELCVSERTIYRDLEALSLAGIPVYAQKGPGGGCALLDSYRTSLTGLTEREARALLMVSIPGPLAELGLDRELRDAVLKVAAAQRGGLDPAGSPVYLDWTAWQQGTTSVPFLHVLYQGICERRIACLSIRMERGDLVDRLVELYGLVFKTGAWYLVAGRDAEIRVYKISQLEDARLLESRFERPADFNLERFWREWCGGIEQNRPIFPVLVKVSPDLAVHLPKFFGPQVRDQIQAQPSRDEQGWLRLELPFETFEEARMRILGFGRAMEVLAPLPLRLSIADFANQISALYST